MKWIDIKKELPQIIPGWYIMTHDCRGSLSVVVFGYGCVNFELIYRIIHINRLATIKPDDTGKYIIGNMIVTHWQKLTLPT